MNVAKWLLMAILALPIAELVVFLIVAAAIGFGWALGLVLATSLAGGLILRHAGGNHIARVRTALDQGFNRGTFTAVQADSTGAATLFAGFLLLIPGFITDVLAVLLLVLPWRRILAGIGGAPPPRSDGVVDLEPEQWHRVPDKELPGRDGTGGRP